jgi:hypothetical protein
MTDDRSRALIAPTTESVTERVSMYSSRRRIVRATAGIAFVSAGCAQPTSDTGNATPTSATDDTVSPGAVETDSVADTETETVSREATSDTPTETGGSVEPEDTPEGPVRILEHELVRETEGTETVSVEGRAKNVSGETLQYVEIEVIFFDETGDELDYEAGDRTSPFVDSTTGIGAGETWSFGVAFPWVGADAPRVADYTVQVGTHS